MNQARIWWLVALVCGGAAGLCAEFAWLRLARLVAGSGPEALALTVAVYLGSLAVGGWWGGRRSARSADPAGLAARAELLAAVLVVASWPVWWLCDRLLGPVAFAMGSAGVIVDLLGLVLVIGPAGVAAGVVVPCLCRAWAALGGASGRSAGIAIALNTAGAVAGCLIAGAVLLPYVGIAGCLVVASGLGGLSAWACQRGARVAGPVVPVPLQEPGQRPPVILLLLAALIGVVGLATEVVWARYLGLFRYASLPAATLAITATLIGWASGAGLGALIAERVRWRWPLLAVLAWGLALALLVPRWVPASSALDWLGQPGLPGMLAAVLPLVLPAFLSGASLPLLVLAAGTDPRWAGRDLGRLALAGTAGGIVGALLIGLVGLPGIGLALSWTALALVAAGAGVLVLLQVAAGWRWLALAVVLLGYGLAIWSASGDPVRQVVKRRGQLTELIEGRAAVLAVYADSDGPVLEIDRLWQGEEQPRHLALAGHIPAILHGAPRRVAVLGLGVGHAARALLDHGVEQLTAIDIEPALPDLVSRRFDGAWLSDERVAVVTADGLRWLRHGGAADLDLVAIEVGQTFRSGIADFYAVETYAAIAERLAPAGLCSQFVPLAALEPEQFQAMLASFQAVFPQTVLWFNTSEMLLIGRRSAPIQLTVDDFLARTEAVRDQLAYAWWGGSAEWLQRPDAFVSGFCCGPEQVRALAADGRQLHWWQPWLAWTVDAYGQGREEPLVAAIAKQLAPLATLGIGEPPWRERAAALRIGNLVDIRASRLLREADLARRQGRTHERQQLLTAAAQANPDNLRVARQLAALRAAEGDNQAAEGLYRQILQRDADDREALLGYGLLLFQHGHLEGGAPYLERAWELAPTDAETLLHLGRLRLKQGRTDDALALLQDGHDRHPSDVDLLFWLGNVLLQTGQVDASLALFRQLEEHGAEVLLMPAAETLALTAGLPSTAYVWAKQVVDDLDLPGVRHATVRAAVLAATGDTAGAAREIEAAVATVPVALRPRLLLRLEQYRRGRAWQPYTVPTP